MRRMAMVAVLALGDLAAAAERPLPLPEAPVRLLIPDADAFDRALTGRFRLALEGAVPVDDPVVAAWRRTQLGSKLEDQWTRLAKDLPWTWTEIRKLQPRRVGLALLDVGHLEAVVVIDTPLAVLSNLPPAGVEKQHEGSSYRLVAHGAADSSTDERRAGLAWARFEGLLILATSERCLTKALDTAHAGLGFAPSLEGLASLELDLRALRQDRYFRREFLFGEGVEHGQLRAALRLVGGRLEEVREGPSDEPANAFLFEAGDALGAGWETGDRPLAAALRAALLEPLLDLADRPLPAVLPLPAVERAAADRYLVDIRRPLPGAAPENEAGELEEWNALFAGGSGGWGYLAREGGDPVLVFEWPATRDAALLELGRRLLSRRAGRAELVAAAGWREWRVGPGLVAAAVRRTGRFLWIARDSRALEAVVEPSAAPDVIRWARLDLRTLRSEGVRWQRLEGPASPEATRPLSDRILGLLGWLPQIEVIAVERRRTPEGFAERVEFE